MENKHNLVLYQKETCPYCQIVRKKLNQLKLPVLLVPVQNNGADRKELIEFSGQQSVPTLVHGDKVIVESQAILSYLDETFGQGATGPMPSNNIGLDISVSGPYEEVVEQTIEALKEEGFGVLTEIDIKATLKKKIDVDVPRHIILGACNPGFAHKAVGAAPTISLLLPCNVTVRETDENKFTIAAVNPVKLLSMLGREDMIPIAEEVRTKLKNALSEVKEKRKASEKKEVA